MKQRIYIAVALSLIIFFAFPSLAKAENIMSGQGHNVGTIMVQQQKEAADKADLSNQSVMVDMADETDKADIGAEANEANEIDVKELIQHHLADSYEWQLISDGANKHIAIPLPIIVRSKSSGWHLFLSSKFNHGKNSYRGFKIASEGELRGKIVEIDNSGNEVRPFDLSLTKNAASLLISSLILTLIFLWVAKSIERDPMKPQKGFAGMMEIAIMMVNDDIIKPAVGKEHRRYAPYLLTLFFFIFFNNLMGLIPIFPGGANVTGNISVTAVLAIGTFLVVNLTGSKKYHRDLFWPDVPIFLKFPLPIMQIIELVGTITKPFALMIRLFANIMAGHVIVLGLTSLIFVTVSLGPAINRSMTFVSLFFSIFILFLELLVAFIQAYVFTLLSSIFIGMAHEEEPKAQSNRVNSEKKLNTI